ncbi:phosphatase PAP2 family protein [Tamaricihabitans halophyticus]|uniref:phosphatase PAP2 family protein n=1 Tax=Tamaricihabitans halophyticus TaxID=1262583 RepID=UPI003C787D83
MLIAVFGLLGTLVLGLTVRTWTNAVGFEAALAAGIDSALGGSWVLSALAVPTEPVLLAAVLVVLCAALLRRRRFPAAVLAVGAPLLAIGLNTFALKPAFGRRYVATHLAYPSGHTVSLVAVLTVVVLLCTHRVARRTAAIALSAVLVCGAGVALIGLGYHHAADIAGGALFAISTVLLSAVGLDSLVGRRAARYVAEQRG